MKPAIAKEVKEEILSKVKAGESVIKVAESYGISNRTIYRNFITLSALMDNHQFPLFRFSLFV